MVISICLLYTSGKISFYLGDKSLRKFCPIGKFFLRKSFLHAQFPEFIAYIHIYGHPFHTYKYYYCLLYTSGGNIEQALEQTTELAVKNSGTKVIAHRGYSSEAPENTLPAYELAAQSGAWGIEADIHRTADGAFVCMHDPTVDRMTDGTGVIAEMTLDEIQMLTIDSGSNSWAYPYARVPTMEE